MDKIEELLREAKDLEDRSIAHEELGEASGFHQAAVGKNGLCQYLRDVLEKALLYHDVLNESVLTIALTEIEQVLKQVRTVSDKIDEVVNRGIHTPQFPGQRAQFTDTLNSYLRNAQSKLHGFEVDVKLAEMHELLSQHSYVEEFKSRVQSYEREVRSVAEEVSSISTEAEKLLLQLQEKTTRQGVEQSQAHFRELTASHKAYEWSWFGAFLVASILAGVAVVYAFLLPTPEVVDELAFVSFLKRLLLVSAAGVALRICLTKYNTERKLRIVYEHRQKVLDQYRSFEAGIGDNAAAKNDFRLEIAKYIFSDPQTGYDQIAQKGAEINLSPIMGAVQRTVGK